MGKRWLPLLAFALIASTVWASITPPGKYHGLVLFDRWGGCYLYGGLFLAYIPEARKKSLRPYAGRCVTLDVQKVYQPMRPGDSRFEDFTCLGNTKVGTTEAAGSLEKVEQVKLTASLILDNPRQPAWKIIIFNQGPTPITLYADELAWTILVKTPVEFKSSFFPPVSDGPSMAMVEGRALFGYGDSAWQGSQPFGQRTVSWVVRDHPPSVSRFELPAGARKEFIVDLTLPEGEYDLIFGYGGAPQSGLVVASEKIAVDVSATGEASWPRP